jgi:hypothetical protein
MFFLEGSKNPLQSKFTFLFVQIHCSFRFPVVPLSDCPPTCLCKLLPSWSTISPTVAKICPTCGLISRYAEFASTNRTGQRAWQAPVICLQTLGISSRENSFLHQYDSRGFKLQVGQAEERLLEPGPSNPEKQEISSPLRWFVC